MHRMVQDPAGLPEDPGEANLKALFFLPSIRVRSLILIRNGKSSMSSMIWIKLVPLEI